jgi:hypothetical protein
MKYQDRWNSDSPLMTLDVWGKMPTDLDMLADVNDGFVENNESRRCLGKQSSKFAGSVCEYKDHSAVIEELDFDLPCRNLDFEV